MRKTRLSSGEIQDLISKYQSELKKLEFQTEEIVSTITELQNWLESVEQSEKIALAKIKKKRKIPASKGIVSSGIRRKRGRPPVKEKKISDKTDISKTKRKKKVRSKKGYKLSNWDEWVISAITQKGSPQLTQEILEFVKIKTQEKGIPSTEEEIKNKVIRSIQKLANRRNDLIKVPHKGRGYAYAVQGMQGIKQKVVRRTKKE